MNNTSYRSSHLGKGKGYHDLFVTPGYAKDLWDFERRILVNIASEFSGLSKCNFLDFACGTCRISALLEPYFDSSFGVDVSETMMEVGRSHVSKTNLILTDITQDKDVLLPVFDMIAAFRFFPGAEDSLQESVILKLSSLLKPGGVLVFSNHRHYGGSFFVLQRLLYKAKHRPWTVRCMTFDRALDLGRLAGLNFEKVYHWGVLPNNESKQVIPPSLSRMIEPTLSRVGFLFRIASSHVYIFRKPV